MVAPADTLRVTLGSAVTLSTSVQVYDPTTQTTAPANDDGLKLYVRAPDGTETIWSAAANENATDRTGLDPAVSVPDQSGQWTRWWATHHRARAPSDGHCGVRPIHRTTPTRPQTSA